MDKVPNVFLVGPSGAGKSTIGREIARSLDMAFYDTDHVIEQQTGVDIAWIFDVEGEQGFREREAAIVKDLADKSNAIVATGGGTVLHEKSCQIMRDSGAKIVYLKVDLPQQFERASRNQDTRPLLRGGNIQEKLLGMAEKRDPLYANLADESFETDNATVKVVAGRVVKYLRGEGF